MELEDYEFNMDEFLNDMELLFKPSAQSKDIAFEIMMDAKVPNHLVGDSFRLRQILSNLIGNAIKFTLHGSILVSVRKLEDVNQNQIKLEFSVKDTGTGVNEAKL